MEHSDLDQSIIQLACSDGDTNAWTLRHAVEGVQIFGGIGSGKTSGSGRMLALKYLSMGFGGLVLTVKPDEKDAWIEYCRLAGRSDDLVIVEPGGPYHFNFINYESRHAKGAQAPTENIVEVLKTVIRAAEEKDSGRSDDSFWEGALDMLIFNVIDLCKLAYGEVTIQLMYDIVQTIPKKVDDQKAKTDETLSRPFFRAFKKAHDNVNEIINQWYEALTLEQKDKCREESYRDELIMEQVDEARLLGFLDQFFFDGFKNLSDKTRSIIDFTFSSFLFRLLREPIYSLFCKGTSTVRPEDSLEGKIILLNLPVKTYHKVGRDCQILFKFIWQRTMEKRDVRQNARPIFLWADEAQNFLHEHDAQYQATARSSRISTVYITQNLPNYYACMGGSKAEHRVKSFLGTLGTKIFHANADIDTNRYASEMIGDVFYEEYQKGKTVGKHFSQNQNMSLKLGRAVRPEEFVGMLTGGPLNDQWVEGYMHRQGDKLLKGRNHLKMHFDQNFLP